MTDVTDTLTIRREIPFAIDGRPYATDEVRHKASELLRMAGLDPAIYDLGEIERREPGRTKRYNDDDIVNVTKGARFVSIRQRGPVA